MRRVLPAIYEAYQERYRNYSIRQLCQDMHDLYRGRNVKQLQTDMFRKAHLPKVAMLPQAAQIEYVRGNVELIPLAAAAGRIAAEGALPYPPGLLCVVPGEVWGGRRTGLLPGPRRRHQPVAGLYPGTAGGLSPARRRPYPSLWLCTEKLDAGHSRRRSSSIRGGSSLLNQGS